MVGQRPLKPSILVRVQVPEPNKIMNREKPPQEPSPENVEAIDQEIERLLEALDNFDYNNFSAEVQEQWYFIEMEAKVAQDRATAKTRLEHFIKHLEELSEK
jgi:hypothetical protein